MIKILYFTIEGQLEQSLWNSYLKKLPSNLQSNVTKYYRWQDQYSNLFGKLLLKHGLIEYGYGNDCLDLLNYNSFKKPFIDKKTYFNLSHSSEIVICAFSQKDEIGIDIEEIKPIEISEFDNIFTEEELNLIQKSIDPINTFYRFWTIKESVVKAIGKGLSLPLSEVVVSGTNQCNFRSLSFNIHNLELNSSYFCSLASTSYDEFTLNKITLQDFSLW